MNKSISNEHIEDPSENIDYNQESEPIRPIAEFIDKRITARLFEIGKSIKNKYEKDSSIINCSIYNNPEECELYPDCKDCSENDIISIKELIQEIEKTRDCYADDILNKDDFVLGYNFACDAILNIIDDIKNKICFYIK